MAQLALNYSDNFRATRRAGHPQMYQEYQIIEAGKAAGVDFNTPCNPRKLYQERLLSNAAALVSTSTKSEVVG